MTQLAPHLATFLREHLPHERRASVHTCDAYSYSFQLLVVFAAQKLRKRPCLLQIEDIDVPMILAYAVAFIIVVQIIEIGLLQPLEARAVRWRR